MDLLQFHIFQNLINARHNGFPSSF